MRSLKREGWKEERLTFEPKVNLLELVPFRHVVVRLPVIKPNGDPEEGREGKREEGESANELTIPSQTSSQVPSNSYSKKRKQLHISEQGPTSVSRAGVQDLPSLDQRSKQGRLSHASSLSSSPPQDSSRFDRSCSTSTFA